MALKMSMSKRVAGAQQQRRQAVSRPGAQRIASVEQVRASVVAKAVASYVVDRRATPARARSASAAPGQPSDAVVLSVLQNYSGLTVDRLFNMLRNSGKFNESQSTLNSILSSLVSQGKVQNERGTFRFVSNAGNGRSPSPAPSRAAPARAATPSAASAGDGKSASDEATVLAVLANYSGLTEDRLSSMLRNSGKSTQSSVSSVLSSLVSQGKVQNDRGTYRYLPQSGKTPTPARSTSPVRTASPVRGAPARAATPSAASAGDGKSASDEATVLAVLANYSGLTEDRLSSMLRNSGKSTKSSVSSVLSSLVSQGKVQNDRGTYRYLPQSGKTPTPARSTSPVARASSAPARPASRTATPSPGDGAASSDEAVVLAMLKNYSGLTADRLSNLLRSSGKSVGSVESVLRGLVSKGRVDNERGIYKFNK